MTTYRDRLKPASFRGVKFLVDDSEKGFGRRVQQHEYPFRDESYFEDLGLKSDVFTISAHLIGDDYDLQRTNLENALAMTGSGELIHPSYPSKQVIPTNVSVRETYKNGRGMAIFSITFVVQGKIVYPEVDEKSTTDISNAKKKGLLNFINSMPKLFTGEALIKVEGFVNEVSLSIRAVARRIQAPAEALARVNGMIDELEDSATELANSPEEFATEVEAIYDEIAIISESEATDKSYQAQETFNALLVNQNFEENFENEVPITEEDYQVQQAQTAIITYNQNISAIYLCKMALNISYVSSDEGEEISALINSWFFELENTNDTELFDALQTLRIQTTKAIAQLTETLTKSKEIIIHKPTPSLVIAHQNNMDELLFVKMNKIRDPLFVVGKVKVIPRK